MIDIIKVYALEIIGALSALLILFLNSFVQEKAKLKALKSENKSLVREAEQIKAEYSVQLEETKKQHQLEISKRKYRYEDKREQYIKFFKLLDEFTTEQNDKILGEFLEILTEFEKNYLKASYQNKKKYEITATTIMSKKTKEILFAANQSLIKIKQETNVIRLTGSPKVIEKLNLLEYALEKCDEQTNVLVNKFVPFLKEGKGNELVKYQDDIRGTGIIVKAIKREIIEVMRIELDEI